MLQVAFVAFVLLVAHGLGYLAAAGLDRGGRLSLLERNTFQVLVGLIVVHFVVWMVSVWRFDAASMTMTMTGLSVAAMPGWWRTQWKALWTWVKGHGAGLDRVEFLFFLVLAILALSHLAGALAPPADYDSLNYHLSLPKRDLEIGWVAISPYVADFQYFPALMENLYRLSLALVGDRAAQFFHASLGLLLALTTVSLARRLGLGRRDAILSAIFLLSIRLVVYETGTCHVDLAWAAYATMAVLLAMAWTTAPSLSLMVAAGVMMGGAFNVKYTAVGSSLALLVPFALVAWRRRRWFDPILAGMVKTAVLAPILLRNYMAVGNPLHPLFKNVFIAGTDQSFMAAIDDYGRGHDIWALLLSPWDIFINGNTYFDGMAWGGPYILALAPLVAFTPIGRRIGWLWIFVVVYWILWFFLLTQQSRFLLPLYPLLSVAAVAGCVWLVKAAWSSAWRRRAVVVLLSVFLALQGMFVGIYSLIRLPVAFGFKSEATYFATTPTFLGSYYAACRYVSDRLEPGQRYVSLLNLQSYWCPQKNAIRWAFFGEDPPKIIDNRPDLKPGQVLSYMIIENVRFVVISKGWEDRENATSETKIQGYDIRETRLGRALYPAVIKARPVFEDRFSQVYAADDLIELLKVIGQ